jgi:hypothetical protein
VGGLLGEISKGMIFETIPLDLFLHFIIGGIITIFCLVKKISHFYTFLALVSIAGLKEANDYFFHYYSNWQEYATDFGITFVYFAISLAIKKFKVFNNKPNKYTKIRID